MKQIKISSNNAEDLFLFVTYFKPFEIVKFQYGKEDNKEVHFLYFTFGALTNNTFNRRVKAFKLVNGNCISIVDLNKEKSREY